MAGDFFNAGSLGSDPFGLAADLGAPPGSSPVGGTSAPTSPSSTQAPTAPALTSSQVSQIGAAITGGLNAALGAFGVGPVADAQKAAAAKAQSQAQQMQLIAVGVGVLAVIVVGVVVWKAGAA